MKILYDLRAVSVRTEDVQYRVLAVFYSVSVACVCVCVCVCVGVSVGDSVLMLVSMFVSVKVCELVC